MAEFAERLDERRDLALVGRLERLSGGARGGCCGRSPRPGSPTRWCIGGDIHSFWANDLKLDFDDPAAPVVATEFVGTSMTSNGPPYEKFAAWVADNPHVRFFDSRKRGYVGVELRPERLEVAFRAVADVRDPQTGVSTLQRFVVENGRPGPQDLGLNAVRYLLRRRVLWRAARAAVGVLRGRKAPGADLLGVFARRGADLVAELAVALDEFRRELGEQAEHVVDHQDLPVAGRRAADADRRDRDRLGQFARDALGGALDDQRKRAGFGDRDAVAHDLVALGLGVAARAVAAERVDRLRRQPDMAHHRHAAPREETRPSRPFPRRLRA